MSRIYFHSPSGSAEVNGRERAHAGFLCNELLFVALGINTFTDAQPYRALLPEDCYALRHKDDRSFFEAFRTWSSVQMSAMYRLPDGRETNVFEVSLNTAVAMGSDAICLLAKLHGQCEIHAYVEGPNRAWLAGIIEQGIKDKILRVWEKDHYGGWPAVIELLKSRDDEPVVTSYSVTEQFPNSGIARNHGDWQITVSHEEIKKKYKLEESDNPSDWIADYRSDLWLDLTESEQWRLAMDGLRNYNVTGTVEMKPETFAIQGYGDGLSGFDIASMLFKE